MLRTGYCFPCYLPECQGLPLFEANCCVWNSITSGHPSCSSEWETNHLALFFPILPKCHLVIEAISDNVIQYIPFFIISCPTCLIFPLAPLDLYIIFIVFITCPIGKSSTRVECFNPFALHVEGIYLVFVDEWDLNRTHPIYLRLRFFRYKMGVLESTLCV